MASSESARRAALMPDRQSSGEVRNGEDGTALQEHATQEDQEHGR